MGDTNSLLVPFFVDEVRERTSFVRRTVEILRENGFETASDGAETIEHYEVDGEPRTDTDATLADVAGEIADADRGKITLWIDGHSARVRFDVDAASEGVDRVPLSLTDIDEYAFREEDVQADVARHRADRLVDAIADIAVETDPWYVTGWCHQHSGLGPYPKGKPPESGVEGTGWVSVFGEAFHDRFGGRDRALEAPAWEVRDLDNGAVLVRETALSAFLRSDAESGPEPPTYEYLFERRSLADLRGEIERQRNAYVDPFRDLEAGELASDVVMCEAHAPFEFEGMDYAAFPDDLDADDRCQVLCVRRGGNALRETTNDEFVRRLVDSDGEPIGDLPDGVPPDQEMISLAVTTEYRGGVSLDMYRMERPDDPSLAARLYGFHRPGVGESIWRDRDEPVSR